MRNKIDGASESNDSPLNTLPPRHADYRLPRTVEILVNRVMVPHQSGISFEDDSRAGEICIHAAFLSFQSAELDLLVSRTGKEGRLHFPESLSISQLRALWKLRIGPDEASEIDSNR
jgi:hypothetical protein